MTMNSFKSGLNQVKYGDIPKIKMELMTKLGITSRAAWSARVSGKVKCTPCERESIEAIFKKYGVTKNIWGN